jgi:cobalt/nickel transport system permease protein
MYSLDRPLSHAALDLPYLQRVDPRARVVAAVALALTIAVTHRWQAMALGLAAALLAVTLARLPLATLRRRLVPLNTLLALLLVLLPLTTPGEPIGRFGPLTFTREGLQLAAAVAVKANAVLLLWIALVGTLSAAALGHALAHLRMPDKLVHLLLFTVRYLEVLSEEYHRLRSAMKIRGFRPTVTWHTYRTYGYLAGMLLVRSFDRSERILAAMKCRGFDGRFWLLDHFAFSRADVPFCLAAAALFFGMIGLAR